MIGVTPRGLHLKLVPSAKSDGGEPLKKLNLKTDVMNREQLVLLALKPKVKALGFNQKELKGIAARIAGNIKLDEEASEEEVSAEIDSQIEAILPFLQLGQSQANRVIDAWKKSRNENETDDEDDDEGQSGSNKSTKNKNGNDATPEWAKSMLDTVKALADEVTALKAEKSTSSRRARLEALLKDTGAFGERTIKSFGRMKFENDDEFDEFYSEVEEDLKKLNQERADVGLSSLGAIPGVQKKSASKEEVLTDDEIKALAGGNF